jgi:3-oxoacyl-[acyl-carrier protein] reductase
MLQENSGAFRNDNRRILNTPEEIAHVIVFVASANASYMTGASIAVDGGMLAS